MKHFKQKVLTAFVALIALLGVVSVLPATTHPVFASAKSEAQQGINDTGAGGSASDVPKLIKGALSVLSYFVGVASIIMIVIGGFKYVTSNGDAGGIASAKNTIIYAIVGLVIAIFAQGIVRFVIDKIT